MVAMPLPMRVFMFGPHFLSFDIDQYLQLRSVLREHSKYSWILETLRELPEWWTKASATLRILQDQGGSQLLTAWADDFNHSNPSSPAPADLKFPLPNIILTPIVAISQLVQYQQYCEQQQQQPHASGARFETVGFCSGTLAAIAVASSPSVSQLDRYGRVAIRLAMLIGAMVDAVDNTSALGDAVSYSVSWNHPRLREHIDRTIHHHPSAYLSVLYDERRATLTLARRDAEFVVRELEGVAGITLTAIGLKGRFHSNEYHADWMESIHRFCDSHPEFQFPGSSQMAWRARFGVDPTSSSSQCLHRAAIEEILLRRCYWYQLVQQLLAELADSPFTLVVFGPDRCLPPSLMPRLSSLVEFAPAVGVVSGVVDTHHRPLQDTDVAVIGMACKLPGANDLGEFWKLLCEPRSQHREVPQERMDMAVMKWRDSPSSGGGKWYGNFIDDYDAFDHRFFKKSPREAASMDPQQRLMLQTAYQAVAQAGHFVQDPSRRTRRVGCYIGVSNVDYENHVACHPANAYSATGTLKSFVAGKVSHFFGWTGPSLTIDTACSGAAVALHQACQALLTGDCDEALAGGVNILASPLWFQNLAGASFLSPTGACKPFDASADGYCRGEGCGAVYLKRAKAALADGDPIIGIIPGTAVQQNENCTPITVPNSVSLTDLFRRVLDKSRLSADQISVVEAHGTGTAVGDPAEYTSIQQVLGGPKRPRNNPVNLGSVKGLVGHLECASGIVAVLKVLLMLKARTIPPHVGLETINPELAANSESQIEIPLSLRPWQAPFRAALINNYGASGSNASLVVMDAAGYCDQPRANDDSSSLKRIPFYFSALDDRALQAYCAKFLSYIASCRRSVTLDALAFNVSRQSNRDLGCIFTLGCASIEDLEDQLRQVQAGRRAGRPRVPQRPVILCFGGQTSTFVGLNRDVFLSNPLLRKHLDECDRMCRSMALDGIYPEIFQKSPIEDVVKLQLALFALQYACAATWIDCGAPVAAVVGHSFGELTALCIAGVLSLEDTLRLIAGRAGLVRDSWGEDRGGMIAAEGDLPVIKSLLERANHRCGFPEGAGASIACVNGPRSFTLAGPTKAMDAIEAILSEPAEQQSQLGGAIRMKRLNVSNAFHSTLVQPLTRDLELLGQSLSYHPARIRVERSTECASPPPSTGRYVADHMRNPVYFHQAVQRLAHDYPSAVWLEAGSNSTITNMASRALGNPASSHFQPVNLTSDSSPATFADVFIKLWDQGLGFVSFWPHHPSQGHRYDMLLLPPYQFELSRHLLPMTRREEQDVQGKVGSVSSTKPAGSEQDLWSLVGRHNGQSRFQIHMDNPKIQEYVSGHTVAGSAPLCPSTLQLELAIETIRSLLQPRLVQLQLQPQLRGLDNHNPLCMDPTRKVWLDAEAQDTDGYVWNWKMTSQSTNDRTLHVSGQIVFVSTEDEQLQAQFSRFERLVDHRQCLALLQDDEADDAILGPRNIYKAFSDVVDYGEVYRGVHKVVGKANRSAGRVVKKYTGSTWLDGPLCDSFCQVAGIFVNCMTDKAANEIRISNRIEQLIRRPQPAAASSSTPDEFHVLAVHSRPSDRVFISDVFVFNPENGDLLGVILGIRYQAVNRIALGKALLRLTPGMAHQAVDQSALPLPEATATTSISLNQPSRQKKTAESQHQSVSDRLLTLLSNVTGVDATAISPDTALADLGIDSLMCMELARDIGAAFQCELKPAQLMELVSFSNLVDLLDGQNSSDEDGEPDRLSDDTSQDMNPPYRTAATTPDESDTEAQSALQSQHAAKMIAHRQSVIEEYVAQYTKDLTAPLPSLPLSPASSSCTDQSTVLVTGATGSLGSHLVAHLLRIPTVSKVICLNRRSGMPADNRQQHAFHSRSIPVDPGSASKLYVYETDTSQHLLGLAADEYERLLSTVTHVVHNAWPMTIARPVQGFEAQFRTWRNLIELIRNATVRQRTSRPISIQFISSIATVGMYPLHKGDTVVPETHMTVESTLASGYGDAKLICEKMLEKTLQRSPTRFRASVVRLGQVAGSSVTGYWNPVEHLAFLFKSAKTLNILPDLPGELSWCPVNEAAAILTDLLLSPDPVLPPVFHVENPVRQPWADMIAALARELDIPIGNIVPFEDWLERMRRFVGDDEAANPAKRVDDFLEEHFVRMACGGVVLDTQQTARISARFRALNAVDPGMVKLFVQYWRKSGFMN